MIPGNKTPPSHREVKRNPDAKVTLGKVFYLPFLIREYKGSRKAIRGEEKSDKDAGQENKKSEEDIRGRLFNRSFVVHGGCTLFYRDYDKLQKRPHGLNW